MSVTVNYLNDPNPVVFPSGVTSRPYQLNDLSPIDNNFIQILNASSAQISLIPVGVLKSADNT